MKRTDVLYSGLEILNTHDHPMVVVLSDMSGSFQFLATSVAINKTVQFSVPVGQYGIQIFIGSDWCNLESGFSDGAHISVDGGITIETGQTTLLEFYGTGLNPVQIALAYSTFSPPANFSQKIPPSEVIGDGVLELLQSYDGHYFSSGTVNAVPVVFMIDTGATIVSVSSEIAALAGIKKCAPIKVSTANGIVNACIAKVAEVTFGSYQITDIDVIVLPNMSGDALLGMNVLRNFRIEQVGEIMRISSR
ncbi:MAG: retroviral-like aspartic protease family protein [Burkholderiales bacterium]|nr:retroviral-like aspartic protease family protein [Burkholderiales bacterium]MDR4517261.1 retroviral-like aspartic protease family protein [Nitrosomonas sp.]